jgi:hypothetical protein
MTKPVILEEKPISLAEKVFLQGLLKPHLDFYRALANRPEASVKTKTTLEFLQNLQKKL